jgi:hypothetical protein
VAGPLSLRPWRDGIIRNRIDIKDLDFWIIPCVLPSIVEIIMAGADGQSTDCLPCDSGDGDYPAGKGALPLRPEAGIAPTRELQAKSVLEGLARTFSLDAC